MNKNEDIVKEMQNELNDLIKSGSVGDRKIGTRIIEQDLATSGGHRGIFSFFKRNKINHGPERIVAGMATMPSRMHTFNLSFLSIIRQVDHLYLYLDGHQEVPAIAQGNPAVTPIFSKEAPGLHANGKFLGLKMEMQDCIYICADDDIYFTSNFVKSMRKALARQRDRAVIGLHAIRFTGDGHKIEIITHYNNTLRKCVSANTLGTGAAMFSSSAISFDVEDWPKVSMADLGLSIEAAKREIPLYTIKRKSPLVGTIEEGQADSLFKARKKDNTFQIQLRNELLNITRKH